MITQFENVEHAMEEAEFRADHEKKAMAIVSSGAGFSVRALRKDDGARALEIVRCSGT